MSEPYDYGDWTEDYHACAGEYGCEVIGGLCPLKDDDAYQRRRAASAAGRFTRPRKTCPTCGQVTGLAGKGEADHE